MRKLSFYLDTNVISDLANPARTDYEVRRRLALLVRCRTIEIFGAAEIIEEFAGMARNNPEQFAGSLSLFWKLVGENVLVVGAGVGHLRSVGGATQAYPF